MFQGKYLHAKNGEYTPWVKRQGDFVKVTVEVVQLSAGNTKGVHFFPYTKSEETPGDGSIPASQVRITANSVGIHEAVWSGINEVFRLRIIGDQDAPDFTLYRIVDMTWWDAVSA